MDFLSKDDNIELAHIQAEIMAKKREQYLNMHPYSIWENKGYYYTWLPDRSKKSGRRQIKRRKLTALEDAIIKEVKESQKVTIEDLFEEYIDRKIKNDSIKPSTVYRYRTVFKRHYVSTGWNVKNIENISIDEFSDFIEDEIGRCSLNAKALSNFKGVTTGILKRAAKKKLITYTYSMVYDFVDIMPQKTRKDITKEIITEKELRAFIRFIIDNQTVVNLSLLFMLLSGLRVGEMSTLKFDDFISDTSFKVQRTETFYKKDDKWVYEVSDRPKTDAGIRTAFIPQQYAWIVKKLRKLNPFSEYVCSKNGKRIRSYSLRNHLYGICRKLPEFTEEKSTHKLRKTFCNILLDQGFDNNFIISVMGHTDIKTSEQYYHFDRKSDVQKQAMIDNIVEFKIV